MPDGRRRSREGWADPMDEEPCAPPVHTHRLPKVVRLALVGLTAAVFLLLIALGLMAVYVYQANQYVQGRGEFRDAENERTNQRINDAICDLLDTLPEGGLLDRPRDKYGCGPGLPIGQLTPDERAQIAARIPPTVVQPTTPPPSGPPPKLTDGASAYRPAPPTPPPAPTRPPAAPPAPAPTTPPGVLDPITEPICTAVGVCLP